MNKDVETKDDNNKLDDFRKFEEFIKDINNGDKEKEDII